MKQTSASTSSVSALSSSRFPCFNLACAPASPAAGAFMILFPSTPRGPRLAPLPPRRPPLAEAASPVWRSDDWELPPRPLPRPWPPRPRPPRALAGGAEASLISVSLVYLLLSDLMYHNSPLGLLLRSKRFVFSWLLIWRAVLPFCLTWDEVHSIMATTVFVVGSLRVPRQPSSQPRG